MNASIYRISLELQEPHSNVLLNVKRGDTNRRLHISLTDGGHPYQISGECTAVFTAVKPDGAKIFNHCQILDNDIIYTTTPQTVAAEGTCECEIKLYGADDRLLTSARFDLVVNETVYNEGDVIESTDEFNELARLIGEASAVPASVLLTEDDSLNALLANGRYYCTGAVSNVLIRSLLEEAGIQIPEKMTREGIFACGLFVDVTRQKSKATEGVIGGPCQHLTVYFLKDKTTNYWVYGYDRAHDQSSSDGTAWGKWYSPTHCGLEIEKEIFVATYGETTTQEIWEAVQAGKICFAVKDGDALPLAWLDGTRYARFASFYGGKSREIDVSLAKGWTESFTKYLAEEDLEGGLEVYMATFGTTTNQEIYDAYTAGKICFATDGTRVLPMLYCDGTRNATFANFSGGINQRFAVVNGTWAATYTRYLEEEALASAVEAALEQAKETFVAVYGETTVDEVIAAVEAGKICFAQKDSGEIWNMGSYSSGEKRVDFYRSYPGVDCELILTADGWTVSEKLRIKVPVVDERSTDDQIPTAKAVLDLFQSLDEAAALEDLAQAGFVAPVADENNAVFVDENNHIFTL